VETSRIPTASIGRATIDNPSSTDIEVSDFALVT
jgi:hypothetical protein